MRLRQEEKLGVSVNRGVPSQLGRLHLDASADLTRTWKQFKVRHAAVLAFRGHNGSTSTVLQLSSFVHVYDWT